MVAPKLVCDITRNLFIVLGLEIDKKTDRVINQEDRSPTNTGDGKFIKATFDPQHAVYVDEFDFRFDPTDPKCTRLMEYFFGRFLKDGEEMGNLMHAGTYTFDESEKVNDKDPKMYRLIITFERPNNMGLAKWTGNWYKNKLVCFLEAIFSLDETFADAFKFPELDSLIGDTNDQ